jgi:hypothetical protein
MTTETTKLKAKLASLTSSLSALESTLAPLFAQTLPETTVALTAIEQAKLQTLLPYIVYDLVFSGFFCCISVCRLVNNKSSLLEIQGYRPQNPPGRR